MSRAVELLKELDEVRVVRRRAVRAGKIVRVKKRLYANMCGPGMKHNRAGKCVPITSKERMALKRLHTSSANRNRARSMKVRARMLNQSMDEQACCNAAISFDPEVYGDDLTDIIDQVHVALQDSDVDFDVDDPDTLPIEVYTENFDALVSALEPFEGITVTELVGDEEGDEEGEEE